MEPKMAVAITAIAGYLSFWGILTGKEVQKRITGLTVGINFPFLL